VPTADSNQKNFTPQVSRYLWNGGTSVYNCMEIMLKIKCSLYVIIPFNFFQSQFVTYLLNCSRINEIHGPRSKIPSKKPRQAALRGGI
jgi:hypothetical protein